MSERIEINPEVCNGRPVVRDTRISVDTVLAYLSAGDSVADILIAHPHLERDDVLACIEYARRLTAARSTILPQYFLPREAHADRRKSSCLAGTSAASHLFPRDGHWTATDRYRFVDVCPPA